MPDDIPQKPLDLDPSTTAMTKGIDSFEPHPMEQVPPAYVREPLFNKKVMVVWALAAFAVWFTVKMVFPVVLESVKTAVVEGVKEAEQKGGGKVKVSRKNGVITITTDAPAPAGSATPALPPAVAIPAAPTGAAAPAPVPAPAKK